jgi:SAM-dependent methyltransferase
MGIREETMVGTEGFCLTEVDRDIIYLDDIINNIFGEEASPTRRASALAREQGRIALGDIGCGTGNTLATWRQEVILGSALEPEQVTGLGITREDYSTSRDELAKTDWQDPNLRYIVRDITRGVDAVKTASLDMAIGYMSVFYFKNPEAGLEEVRRMVRPEGHFMFNSHYPDMRSPRSRRLRRIDEHVAGWKAAGHSVIRKQIEIYGKASEPSRQLFYDVEFKA